VPGAAVLDRVIARSPPGPRAADADAAVRAPGAPPEIRLHHRVALDHPADLADHAIVEADCEARRRRLLESRTREFGTQQALPGGMLEAALLHANAREAVG